MIALKFIKLLGTRNLKERTTQIMSKISIVFFLTILGVVGDYMEM